MTLALIGSGTMGEAMLKVAIQQDLVPPQQIVASDIRADRLQELETQYGIQGTTNNAAAVHAAKVVVLAVKPQVLPVVLDGLCGQIPPRAVVLSIVAGAPLHTLVEGLQHDAVVRCMPNTPAQIGEGMAVWTATEDVSKEQRRQVQALLQAMGQEVYVQKEQQLDMATAVSGSGPAYVFLIMEAMVDAAVHLGFSRPVSKQLILQTVLGSVRFAAQSDKHLAELRNMVTTPGGTAVEAIAEMEAGALRAVILRGIQAAFVKSCRLGDEKK